MIEVNGENDVGKGKKKDTTEQPENEGGGTELLRLTDADLTQARFDALMDAANDGDKHAQAELSALFEQRPDLFQQVQQAVINLADRWTELYAGKDWAAQYAHKRYMAAQGRALLGDNPTQLERMLVGRVLLNSVALQAAEASYLHNFTPDRSLDVLEFLDRRIDRAQRRYLTAMKTLAQVRRLQLPPIGQLNIGTNQVNIAAAAPTALPQDTDAPPQLALAPGTVLLEPPDDEPASE
jgi:hypothetical protein